MVTSNGGFMYFCSFFRKISQSLIFSSVLISAIPAIPIYARNSTDAISTLKQGNINYEWAVIGAGPAGILAIGLLIENGIAPSSIAWIDPEFQVGALGKYYQGVPANLSTAQWITVLDGCNYLKKCPKNPIEYLKKYDLNQYYPLELIVKPLQEISYWLLSDVHGLKEKVTNLESQNGRWIIEANKKRIIANKVILATGSHPRSLDYNCKEEIPLNIALSPNQLARQVNKDDVIAVVGSAHSAVSVMMLLSQLPVKKIINLYNHPFLYTMQTPNGPVNAETGLKGAAATFAREILETNALPEIQRVYNDQLARETYLPQCTKIIYAVGFEQNITPLSHGKSISYDDTTGIISPHLYGFGIAFPERKPDAAGKIEHRVGLPHFLNYGKRVIPNWIAEQ